MRTFWCAAALGAALVASTPAAQAATAQTGGIPTETQERLRNSTDIPWDLLGLLGLFGLLGLKRDHADDGYHPSPVE